MSGGVDSSVAAALLQRDGHEVVGCFMRLGSPGDELETPRADLGDARPQAKIGHQGCCSINDAADARLVAAKLGIPFYVVNFRNDFGRIIEYFEREYHEGRTPNPCVRCNDWLKYGKLRAYAEQLGCDAVATGHYAQVVATPEGPRVARGVDHAKDQSYVLFGIGPQAIARMLLPIGGFEKPRVRELAREFGLPVSDKPDSQEICFVPDDYASFLERRQPARFESGAIEDESGRVLGTHEGHQRFTVGQRKGLRVPATIPLFVIRKDAARNTVVVGPRESLEVRALEAAEVVWYGAAPEAPIACTAQVRAHGAPIPAQVSLSDGVLRVAFDRAEAGVAPGQAIVCYDREDRILGGGWIRATFRG
ncbi:MAG: tRNA 2-thiouridine(34) synthase MnmA [Phycisphaera sp.]|nr:tRNA 2-thiouridine(34) synthase MnmA [Phycisphaera sp.]